MGLKVPLYPTNAAAKNHYLLGDNYLKSGEYEKAAQEFRRTIEIERAPVLPHARLATAYYAQQKYLDAAASFNRATELVGGPSNAVELPIMQVLSLMRGGKTAEAEKLLKEWTGPAIVAPPIGGAYYVGAGKLAGFAKTTARYLLGDISEDNYLEKAPEGNLSFPYLFVGIKNVVDKNNQVAHEYLSKALDLSVPGTWRRVIAKEELRLLQ